MTNQQITFLEKERKYIAIKRPNHFHFNKRKFQDRFIEGLVSKEPIREYQLEYNKNNNEKDKRDTGK